MPEKKSKKPMTIEDLAGKLDNFASQVDKRFSDVDKRFEFIDKRFDNVDKQLNGIQKDFENLNEVTSNSFNNLEAKMATRSDLKEISDKFEVLEIRVDEIHEVTVGLEEGEIQTGKSMRKLQKIVNRLSRETR
ncbi:MAG TPA: hypothetical protein VFK07_01110 [Candidatus Paceibacterota bacterium]|nr:hypothetical protein [Candidatus Paceibacterota bacterium]